MLLNPMSVHYIGAMRFGGISDQLRVLKGSEREFGPLKVTRGPRQTLTPADKSNCAWKPTLSEKERINLFDREF